MKLTKRFVAVLLACAMALCMLTACGGGSSGSKDEVGEKLVSALAEKGIHATLSSDLSSKAKILSNPAASSKDEMDAIVNAANDGDSDKADELYNAFYDKIDKAFDDNMPNHSGYTWYEVDEKGIEKTLTYIAENLAERQTEKGYTITKVGYSTFTAYYYGYDETTGKYCTYSAQNIIVTYTFER